MGKAFNQAGIQAGDLSGMAMMNMAVNGFRNVSQENASSLITLPNNSSKYITDQEVGLVNGSMGVQAQRVTGPFPSIPGIPYGTKYTCTTAAAVLGAGDYFQTYQPIEGNRISRLGWGTALGTPLTTFRVIRPNFPLVAYVNQSNLAGTRTRFTRVVCPANQDTLVPATFLPEPTGVWSSDNTVGLYDALILAAGSGRQGTPDTWLSTGGALAGADISNLAAAAGQSVIVSGLVMFPGIVPISKETLPLIARHVPDEQALSQRYFYPITDADLLGGVAGSASALQQRVKFPVPMRAVPIVSILVSGTYRVSDDYTVDLMLTPNTIGYSGGSNIGGRVGLGGVSGLTIGRWYGGEPGGGGTGVAAANARMN